MKYEAYREFKRLTMPMNSALAGKDTLDKWFMNVFNEPFEGKYGITFCRFLRMLRTGHDLRNYIDDAFTRRVLCNQLDSRLGLPDELTYRTWLDVMDMIDTGDIHLIQ